MKTYQPMDIIFYKGNSLISKSIRRMTNSQYSRCSLILNEFHCIESAWNNPLVIKHFGYKNKTYDIYRVNMDLTSEQLDRINKFIMSNINSGYDFLFLITRGFHILFNFPIMNSKKSMTCDELILESFKQIGIELLPNNVTLSPESLSKSTYLTKIS